MLKAAGKEGAELAKQLAEAVFISRYTTGDWEENFVLNLNYGKGEVPDHGNDHGFKPTDQVMKLLERVLDFSIPKMMKIDETQFGFVTGPSSLLANYRRSTLLVTNHSTLPSSILRGNWIVWQRRSRGRPWGASVWMNGPCVSSRAYASMPWDPYNAGRVFAWDLHQWTKGASPHWSSGAHHGHPGRVYLPSSRRGRLACK